MRIIFISTLTGWPWGGSEELWSQTAVRLAAGGHEVSALMEKHTPLAEKAAALPGRGVRLRLRDSARGALAKAVARRLTGWQPRNRDQAWVRAQRPDLVVISQSGSADGVGWMEFCLREKIPYAPIMHFNADSFWPGEDLTAALARAYAGAVRVCGVSRNNVRLLEAQLGRDLPNARVVWNPNNVAAAGLLPWPAENGTASLACVARLDPAFKGQDVLLKVLAQPVWRNRPVELNLYGMGPGEQSLRRLAAYWGLERINFRGHVGDLAAIWRENQMLVMPSRDEGVPMTVVEAMSCGRPTVVTDVGRCAELCAEGETGFVASTAAPGPLAEALERAWARRGDWPQMGVAARARILTLVPRDPVGDFGAMLTGLGAQGGRADDRSAG